MSKREMTVQILLATKNGEEFLRDQLKSIASQNGVRIGLIVLDSNSVDRTRLILHEFSHSLNLNLKVESRKNASEAFFHLIELATPGIPIMFSDQDDIWYDDKALNSLWIENRTEPVLLSCNREIFYTFNGRIDRNQRSYPEVLWKSSLTENLAYGNTITINSKGLELLRKIDLDIISVRHYDMFLYQFFAVYGEVILDDYVGVRYRIHDNNLVGLRKTGNPIKYLERVRDSLECFRVVLSLELKPLHPAYKEEALHFISILGSPKFYIRIRAFRKCTHLRMKKYESLLWIFLAILSGFRFE